MVFVLSFMKIYQFVQMLKQETDSSTHRCDLLRTCRVLAALNNLHHAVVFLSPSIHAEMS